MASRIWHSQIANSSVSSLTTRRRPQREPVPPGKTWYGDRPESRWAGLLVISADPDGPPLGGLTWPGIWIVTGQHRLARIRLCRWDNVVIEFEELRGGEGAGDREPRIPLPDTGALASELEPPAGPRRHDPAVGRQPSAAAIKRPMLGNSAHLPAALGSLSARLPARMWAMVRAGLACHVRRGAQTRAGEACGFPRT